MGLSRCKPAILEWPSLYITLLGLVKYLALPITNITFSILGWSIINNTPWTQWLISYQKMGGVSKSPPQKGLLIPNLMALPHIRGVLMWKKTHWCTPNLWFIGGPKSGWFIPPNSWSLGIVSWGYPRSRPGKNQKKSTWPGQSFTFDTQIRHHRDFIRFPCIYILIMIMILFPIPIPGNEFPLHPVP